MKHGSTGITVQLIGVDGNAFSVLGHVMKAMRRGGCTKEQIDAFQAEAMSGDYQHLMTTVFKWVDVDG